MPMALYGDFSRHAFIEALVGAVHASKAEPVKLPGWTVLKFVAPSARISANDDAPRTTALISAAIPTLRRAGVRTPMTAFLGGKRPPSQASDHGEHQSRTVDLLETHGGYLHQWNGAVTQ